MWSLLHRTQCNNDFISGQVFIPCHSNIIIPFYSTLHNAIFHHIPLYTIQSLFHSVTANISTGCNVIIIPFHAMHDWFHLTLCNDYSISRKYSISRCVIITPPDTTQCLWHLTRCNNNSTSHNLIIIPSHARFSTRSQGLLKKSESWQQELISLSRNTKAQNRDEHKVTRRLKAVSYTHLRAHET